MLPVEKQEGLQTLHYENGQKYGKFGSTARMQVLPSQTRKVAKPAIPKQSKLTSLANNSRALLALPPFHPSRPYPAFPPLPSSLPFSHVEPHTDWFREKFNQDDRHGGQRYLTGEWAFALYITLHCSSGFA